MDACVLANIDNVGLERAFGSLVEFVLNHQRLLAGRKESAAIQVSEGDWTFVI